MIQNNNLTFVSFISKQQIIRSYGHMQSKGATIFQYMFVMNDAVVNGKNRYFLTFLEILSNFCVLH